MTFYEPEANVSSSNSCGGRCALFVLKEDKPLCQCDGLCHQYADCCHDYRSLCLQPTVPENSSDLAWWVGATIGAVFGVVIILTVIYYVALWKRRSKAKRLSQFIVSVDGLDHLHDHLDRSFRVSEPCTKLNSMAVPTVTHLSSSAQSSLPNIPGDVQLSIHSSSSHNGQASSSV